MNTEEQNDANRRRGQCSQHQVPWFGSGTNRQDDEELQKEAVEEIDDVSLANYVKLLAKLVIPLISAEDLRESTIKGIKFGTFLVKNRKAKFDIKLPEINEKMKFDRLRSLPKQAKLFSSLNIY